MTKTAKTIKHGILVVILMLGMQISQARADRAFLAWIENFYPIAYQNGVSRSTLLNTFNEITGPDRRTIKRVFTHAKQRTMIWDYMDGHINPYTIDSGVEAKLRHRGLLNALESIYDVDQEILLAIWAIDSNYGQIVRNKAQLHNAPHALATLAFMNKKHAKFARKQLLATLQIIQEGHIKPKEMYGSWFGSLGQTQFNATRYQLYAVDADRDGKKDVWNSIPDALATAANFLNKVGWRDGRDWGYETIGPLDAYRYRDQKRSLSEWAELGFKPVNARRFPKSDDLAELKFLAGRNGPAFLVKQNYYVLRQHNKDKYYALAVCLLADRLKGKPKMVQDWPRPEGTLQLEEKIELQKALAKLGLFKAPFDGAMGPRARAAINAFQRKHGLPVTQKVSLDLLEAVKTAANT